MGEIKFKFDVPGVVHAEPSVIRFTWRNKDIDLRTASQTVVKAIANDPRCTVLQLTKTEMKAAAEATKEEAGKRAASK